FQEFVLFSLEPDTSFKMYHQNKVLKILFCRVNPVYIGMEVDTDAGAFSLSDYSSPILPP
ncbi:MAG: hypothetical protein R3211_07030, partial [Balneolaceae bacterium]|nr:hypothetical protein [Balneolaceae bacterium]